MAGAYFGGGVRRAGVYDDDFVGHACEGVEAAGYIAFFVLGDDDGGDVHKDCGLWIERLGG